MLEGAEKVITLTGHNGKKRGGKYCMPISALVLYDFLGKWQVVFNF